MSVRLFRVGMAIFVLMTGVLCLAMKNSDDESADFLEPKTAVASPVGVVSTAAASPVTPVTIVPKNSSVEELSSQGMWPVKITNERSLFTVDVGTFSKSLKGEDFKLLYVHGVDQIDGAGEGSTALLIAEIFDGHGGPEVARRAAGQSSAGVGLATIVEDLLKIEIEKQQRGLERNDQVKFQDIVAHAFVIFDAEVGPLNPSVGTTATAVFALNDMVYIAYVGDSRCVVKPVYGDFFETADHSLNMENSEYRRVIRAGGIVRRCMDPWEHFRLQCGISGGRVSGLAMSRSLGDYLVDGTKPHGLSPHPVVIGRPIESCDFLIMASDGLWDLVSSKGAIDFVTRQFQQGLTAQEAAKNLIEYYCQRNHQGEFIPHDDMTVIVIKFNHENPR